MSMDKYFEGTAWEKEERTGWPPVVKMILAFIIMFLVLSPAILGIYWGFFLGE